MAPTRYVETPHFRSHMLTFPAQYHQSVIDNAREAERVFPGRPVAIALDTVSLPKTRSAWAPADTPRRKAQKSELATPRETRTTQSPLVQRLPSPLTTSMPPSAMPASCMSNPASIRIFANPSRYVDYKNITKVIEKDRIIYVDDGVLSFQVLEIVDDKTIRAKCLNNGRISSKKGVNLPKTDVDLPPLSEKDKADLRFGVKNQVDMVFASFIRRGSDIKAIREVLGEEGKNIQIIAKIENQQGVNNFDEILKETDGVMVARGDLGIEIPPAQVFVAQKMMIAKCNLAGKPIICATQMLESMTYNPRPTRAEVSDVGNAVLDGADCVMLSGETAKGNYPEAAVTMMAETCLLAESAISYQPLFNELRGLTVRPVGTSETCAIAAVAASFEQNAGCIIVLSTSGNTARLLAKYRPKCPIFMVTRSASVARFSHLYRGVYPFIFPEPKPDFDVVAWQEDVDKRLRWGMARAIEAGLLNEGENVIAVQGWRGGLGHTNTLRILTAQK